MLERKLATVLFVDLVGSTAFTTQDDPEIVRRRVDAYFESTRRCIEQHGGTVEKFAGDAVMAAFGIPRAHEDDADRALRAALLILDSVRELGLEARIGVESGEVLAGEGTQTFATGPAVNLAARLEQAAAPNEILVGPGARGLARSEIDLQEAGRRELPGFARPLPIWRLVGIVESPKAFVKTSSVFVGRESELELLTTTWERTLRASRAHLFTIYGDPGIGKSRLAREFVEALEGATILAGRCLPYGEGITYWPLAEMVKAAAGIADDDPVEEAYEKLRACCEDEAVADLIGLAVGVLEALEREASPQEIAWAAREWAEQLAGAQPLVLVFEDIHWAEEPLLELVESLAGSVREAPLLIVCLARPELLDVHEDWGGGRMRSMSIELEPLDPDESEQLTDTLIADTGLPSDVRDEILRVAEGNPLFVEETVRMLAQGGDGHRRIPETLQALIAARIDSLPPVAKTILQRAAVIGRTFWLGALAHVSSDVDNVDEPVEDLELREFVLREPRSTITGESAFRFKHVLIREVAYAGLPKQARAHLHRNFAGWLHERAGEELVEIRAYHLDHAAQLIGELDGKPPPELAAEAAKALEAAGKRALARESNQSARKLLLRAVELEPTLQRRYRAAVAAYRLADFPALASEMEEVLAQAREVGDSSLESRALYSLAEVALGRDADVERAGELADLALAVVPDDDLPGRFDALMTRGVVSWSQGHLLEDKRFTKEALELAREGGRKDLESTAAQHLASIFVARMELDQAQPLVDRACELAVESGSIEAKGHALASRGRLLSMRGDLEDAERAFEEARGLFEEAGAGISLARALLGLAWLAWRRGNPERAEKLLRESIRILKPLEDRSTLCESQRTLAQVLVTQGRLEEAERVALEARKTVGPRDQTSRATTRLALALVRTAQGRQDEAEELLREALDVVEATDFVYTRFELLHALRDLLAAQGREDEAAAVEEQLAEFPDVTWGQPAAASTARIA
ncbi:MAG TPA: AAA family ATPase [Gaiellaceae bacterium]|nr:AAA family ATPase [Gaiellaceae bacterium]